MPDGCICLRVDSVEGRRLCALMMKRILSQSKLTAYRRKNLLAFQYKKYHLHLIAAVDQFFQIPGYLSTPLGCWCQTRWLF